MGQSLKSSRSQVDVNYGENMLEMRNRGRFYHTSNKPKNVSSLDANEREKVFPSQNEFV